MDLGAVVVGVSIFLLGQFILKFVLEPVVAARETLARAQETFLFFADMHSNPMAPGPSGPTQRQLEASDALRRTGGSLRVIPASLFGYRWVRRPFGLPSTDQLNAAATGFIGLSNNLFGSGSFSMDFAVRYSDAIKRALHWPT
jgi:hypothetical protein